VLGAVALVPVPWALGALSGWLLLAWLALPLVPPLVRTVAERSDGPALNAALARTGLLQLSFCLLLSAGILLSD
jgi:1,4-dihydroxy-2-naphthoate octaprenyltransferase